MDKIITKDRGFLYKYNMCRITGFLDLTCKGNYNLEKTITNMRDTLTYGGPDDAGNYIDKQSGLALGHRRLSIIDLSMQGHQPMIYDDLVIVYNGEVYNFKEIRKELEQEGYTFNSNSDTEVILKAFHRWGFDSVNKFRGMWAFAIWDKQHKELILCRDRMGVKPLYWYYKDGLFMFSSELKAFHKHQKFYKQLNPSAISLFLHYGYIPAPYSIYEHVHKLEPGNFLVMNQSSQVKTFKYWDISEYIKKGYSQKEELLKKTEDETAKELEQILTDSFKLRLVSDVPVGMFLSGGIDSSLVSALLANQGIRLKTFTIGFHEKKYNEAHYAKKVAEYLGHDHTELYCTPKDAFDIIPKLSELYDEPFGDSSAIPTFLVSQLAKQQVKVSLSADGGDEQFCGYTRYWLVADRMKRLNNLHLKPFLTKIVNMISPELAFTFYKTFRPVLPEWTNFRDKYKKLKNILKYSDIMHQYELTLKTFLEDDIEGIGINASPSIMDILNYKNITNIDDLSLLMYIDLKTYLPDDILVKIDRASMGVALEGREPFLDNKIVEFSSALPVALKYKNGVSKYILRKILYKYVPSALLERPKQGFGIPLYEWFKNDLKNLYKEYLNKDRIKKEKIFNPEYVSNLVNDYFNNKGVHHNKLWLIFVFEMWKEKYL